MKENFTAILPVTCNANCGFCPEKEMENKASKRDWLKSLDNALSHVRLLHDHVSLSGGEPTLDPRLLSETIALVKEGHGLNVGITSNGQFLETYSKVASFINACTHSGRFVPYFLNISRHAFDNEENNRRMGVNYTHTLDDIFALRRGLPVNLSMRLNMVISRDTDVLKLFNEAYMLHKRFINAGLGVAFRTDYRDVTSKEEGLVPKDILNTFMQVFGGVSMTYSCPTCVTYESAHFPNFMLKGGDFEPTSKEPLEREHVFHQDGILYSDWTRQKPVDLIAARKEGEEKLLEMVAEHGITAFLVRGRKFEGLTEQTLYRLAGIVEENNRKRLAETAERKHGPRETCGFKGCGYVPPVELESCGGHGGSCGGSAPYDEYFEGDVLNGKVFFDEEKSGCGNNGGCAPTRAGCGGGNSGGCGNRTNRYERSQSNCGGVNAIPFREDKQ